MEDKNFDEKMKDIEREIDTAIDQLFVDKIAGSKSDSDFETFEPQQEITLEQEVIEEAEAKKEVVEEAVPEPPAEEEILPKDETESNTLQELETLKSRIEKFLEWGVTSTALDNVSQAIHKIRQDFMENKFVESVTHMVMDVLNFLKENPESHLKEMVDFLANAISSIQKIIRPEKEEGIDDGDVFNSINAQFSSISSMLTFDIPKIELEERFTIPSEEGQEPQPQAEETVKEGIEQAKEEIKTGAPSLEMAFVDLEEAEKKEEKEEIEEEKAAAETELTTEESETEGFEQVTIEEEAETETVTVAHETFEVEETKEMVPSYKTFNQILNEFSNLLKNIEGNFYRKNNVLDLAGKLSTEIETLVTTTEKFISVVSYGVPSENDTQQLQKAVNEVSRDFETLSSLFGVKEGLYAEEIVPVIVGRKMMGLLSTSVKNIYSVSDDQVSRIKQKGTLLLKGREIPFVDLMEELGEVSNIPNKRIVVVGGQNGEKALLVGRVMKRRFALVSDLEESGIQRSAKFYFAEEIPIYET